MDDAAKRSRRETGRESAEHIVLDPVLASAPRARHWITARLGDVPDELRRTAALLVSELVGNAVLHAASPVTVALDVEGHWVRVEVGDASRELPTPKRYGEDAATGRGLTVLETLADRWGAHLDDVGKVVWFELGDPPHGEPGAARPGPAAATPAAPRVDDLVDMALVHVPVVLLVRTQAAYEELFREFRLLVERNPAESRTTPGRLLEIVDEMGTRFSGFTAGATEAWHAAAERGDELVDLNYVLPRSVGPACRHLDALLDEAHAFCRAAALLTLAPPPEIVALRKWSLGEFGRQAAGGRAISWDESSWAARVAQHT